MQTIEDLIKNQTGESLHLEFKRSDLLINFRPDDICKAISALANSDGGRLVFGISEDKNRGVIALDAGISTVGQTIERLDNAISDSIAPRIPDVQIVAEEVGGRSYVSVFVPKSSLAPHQSSDKRFYKRSNNRSFPMEAYEIDDVRSRSLVEPNPLAILLEVLPSSLAHLVVWNRGDVVCRNVTLALTSNFSLKLFNGALAGEIALSRIGVGQRVEYFLDTTPSILSRQKDAALEINGSYEVDGYGKKIAVLDRISIGELLGSSLPRDAVAERLKDIAKEVASVKSEIKRVGDIAESLGGRLAGLG